jgi:hypothetical protein
MNYGKWHRHLRRDKGAPGACVACGATGKNEWALKEEFHVDGARVFVEDVNAYEPMCVRCHRKRDYSSEHGEKISAALSGRTFSVTHRENLSKARQRFEERRKEVQA